MIDLDDALADAQWAEAQARATLQTSETLLETLSPVRHPVLWLRLRRRILQLRRVIR